MSGYRCVNYYELCRLCTASQGGKIHIFSEEGRKRNLYNKITKCLPIVVRILVYFNFYTEIKHEFILIFRLMKMINCQKLFVQCA